MKGEREIQISEEEGKKEIGGMEGEWEEIRDWGNGGKARDDSGGRVA